MTDPVENNLIPASEVDRLEWLATEALWSTAKFPFDVQWDRWLTYTNWRDQMSVPGLVIQGNLQRYHAAMSNALRYGQNPEQPDPEFLSQAAEHLGKMAGGLVGISTQFATPMERFRAPLMDLIPGHIVMAENAWRTGTFQREATVADEYYGMLQPVHNAVKTIRQTRRAGIQQREFNKAAHAAMYTASVASRTWGSLLARHEDIALVPGGTPRSGGPYIEDLRADFEQYIPVIREAVAAYRGKADSSNPE